MVLKFEETIMREGWPVGFRLATERAWLRAGIEVDKVLSGSPDQSQVKGITFSWEEKEKHPTHSLWLASVQFIDK